MPRLTFAAALLAGSLFSQIAAAEESWAERIQIFHDQADNSVSRRPVRVADPHPELGLAFTWEPKDGAAGISAEGFAEGRGRLVWRIKGSADYDPRAVHSTFNGVMKAGRMHGPGRLEMRGGEMFEGEWRNGRLEGQGLRKAADGSRYEGAFANGLENGEGRLALANGDLFSGQFRNGLREGRGRLVKADGGSFESLWTAGRETGPRAAELAGSSNAGGILAAQTASGGDAARFDIGFVIDEKITGEAEMQYQHLVQEKDVAIYPVEQEINDSWAGKREINDATWPFEITDWADAPAYVELGLQATDGAKAKISALSLEVAKSEAYNKPFLAIEAHLGCVAFRPSFSFINFGWGPAKSAKLTMKFTNEAGDAESAKSYTADLGDFGEGMDVPLKSVLAEAGVDVDALETKRFPCPSAEQLGVCKAQMMNAVSFGDVANTVWGEDKLFTTAKGTIDYAWNDEAGAEWTQSEPFKVDIALARIEFPAELAECGDGSGASPEALRYIDVDLPLGKQDYKVDVPVRGNKNIRDYTARLKLHAEKTSYHEFRALAEFADGSTLQSKPVSFYFFKPRERSFASKATPSACYYAPDDGSC